MNIWGRQMRSVEEKELQRKNANQGFVTSAKEEGKKKSFAALQSSVTDLCYILHFVVFL